VRQEQCKRRVHGFGYDVVTNTNIVLPLLLHHLLLLPDCCVLKHPDALACAGGALATFVILGKMRNCKWSRAHPRQVHQQCQQLVNVHNGSIATCKNCLTSAASAVSEPFVVISSTHSSPTLSPAALLRQPIQQLCLLPQIFAWIMIMPRLRIQPSRLLLVGQTSICDRQIKVITSINIRNLNPKCNKLLHHILVLRVLN